eukprot:TRINITY_DN11779_c0_g1_i1.p1 TRINITY_DN11779_c0_g1~~TRINITY_DN11779_c0_g1_i1.p1  ORF type:complete len:105 (+),score=24.57 TRINITY_DN11779_c0_g1_i1:427-741(+)
MTFDNAPKNDAFDSLSELFDSEFDDDFLVDLGDENERIDDDAPPCPDYFDRNCSFCTKVEARIVLPVIADALRDAKCDNLDIKDSHFWARGTFYINYSSVSFSV